MDAARIIGRAVRPSAKTVRNLIFFFRHIVERIENDDPEMKPRDEMSAFFWRTGKKSSHIPRVYILFLFQRVQHPAHTPH